MSALHTISKEYKFEAGHRLLGMEPGHQCGRIHGHSYVVIVELMSMHLDTRGMVMDYAELDTMVNPLVKQFDHYLILSREDAMVSVLEENKEPVRVIGMNPTAEALAGLFWEALSRVIDATFADVRDHEKVYLSSIVVKETAKTTAEMHR